MGKKNVFFVKVIYSVGDLTYTIQFSYYGIGETTRSSAIKDAIIRHSNKDQIIIELYDISGNKLSRVVRRPSILLSKI